MQEKSEREKIPEMNGPFRDVHMNGEKGVVMLAGLRIRSQTRSREEILP